MSYEDFDIPVHRVILTNNCLESLIESYRQDETFLVITEKTPSYYIYSIIKEKLDRGENIHYIIEKNLFRKNKSLNEFEYATKELSDLDLQFAIRKEDLARKIINKAFEIWLEKNHHYSIPFKTPQLSESALNIAKKIVSKEIIDMAIEIKMKNELIEGLKNLNYKEIPEILRTSFFVKETPKIVTEEPRGEEDFNIIYEKLLNLKNLNATEIQNTRDDLENNYHKILLNHYLSWDLDDFKGRPLLISDVLNQIFGILFDNSSYLHPQLKTITDFQYSSNVVFLLFDNIGYIDCLYSMETSKLWKSICNDADIEIFPMFTSFLTNTNSALSLLIKEYQEKKSLIEKIVDKMIEEDDSLSINCCSQWIQNNPYNKRLFDTMREGITNIPQTIFTLNSISSYVKDITSKHYFLVYSSSGISHDKVGKDTLVEHVEQNIFKRIREAINLFPNSTIIAVGDHGVQWNHTKIDGGKKLNGNKRISLVPINDFYIKEVFLEDHQILKHLNIEYDRFYPLKPGYLLELPSSKIEHGGFSFSENIVPFLIIRPSIKEGLDGIIEEEIDAENDMEELEEELPFLLENVKDIILHYLEHHGPSFQPDIYEYVSSIKKNTPMPTVFKYLHDYSKTGYIRKGDPSEGFSKRAPIIIWYLPKHENDYKNMVDDLESLIMTKMEREKAYVSSDLYKILQYRRHFILSILYRLAFKNKLRYIQFDNTIFTPSGKVIYTKSYVFFLPNEEAYAQEKIKIFKTSHEKKRRKEKLLTIQESIIIEINKKLNFEVPKIIENRAIELAHSTLNNRTKGSPNFFNLVGTSLLLSFNLYKIPIQLEIVGDATQLAYFKSKNKDINNIEKLDKHFANRRRIIWKTKSILISGCNLKIPRLTIFDYLNYLVFLLDIPYHIKFFGEKMLQELKNKILSGNDPFGFIGAIIYYTSKILTSRNYCTHSYSQNSIAKSTLKTEVTIRKNFKQIKNTLKFNPLSMINRQISKIKKSNNFELLELITQQGKVDIGKLNYSIEYSLNEFIKKKKDFTQNIEIKIERLSFQDNKSIIFFLQNAIIEKILKEKVILLFTTNSYISNLIPGISKIFICQNSIDRFLRVILTPLGIIKNVPLSLAMDFIGYTGIDISEFYVQSIDQEYIHMILIDTESIEEYSVALFDILQDVEPEEFQKGIIVPEIDGEPLYDYIVNLMEEIDDNKPSKVELYQEWLKKEKIIEAPPEDRQHPPIEAEKQMDYVIPIDSLKTSIDKIENEFLLNHPKNCLNIINESIQAAKTKLYGSSLERIFSALERLLFNYHSSFIRSSERLDIHGYLSELWKEKLISLELRDQINLLAKRRNEVKHGRLDVDENYFNSHIFIIFDAIQRLCYEFHKIPVIHNVIELLKSYDNIINHSMIPIKDEPDILKKWLFNKPEQLLIYEREESRNTKDQFNLVIELFKGLMHDKRRKKFYLLLEANVKKLNDSYIVNEIKKLK